MARFMFTVLALAFLSTLAMASRPCYDRCRFKFCDDRVSFKVGTPDVAFTGPICFKDSRKYRVGYVDETGEARLFFKRRFIRISRIHRGLKQRFSPSFFKAYAIRRTKFSGVGHEVPQQNQAKFLNRKCWVLPIKKYQILNRRHYVIKNARGRSFTRDCVAFETRLPCK